MISFKKHRDEEHALLVTQMRDGEYGHPRFAVVGIAKLLCRERLALHPGREAGRRQQVVQTHGEREAVLRRVERVEIHHADTAYRRLLDLPDQAGDVEIAAIAPRMIEDLRQQNVLPALDRVGVDAGEREYAGGGGLDSLAIQVDVVDQCVVGRRKRPQDRDRYAGVGAWRVHGDVGALFQLPDSLAVLTPGLQALLPQRGLRRGELIDCLTLVRRGPRVHPRFEVRRGELRERQFQIRQVAFWVDRNDRDVVECGLLQEPNAETGLAGAGHADDDRVGRQVFGIVEDQVVGLRTVLIVNAFAEVERTQFFEIVHRSFEASFGGNRGHSSGLPAGLPARWQGGPGRKLVVICASCSRRLTAAPITTTIL